MIRAFIVAIALVGGIIAAVQVTSTEAAGVAQPVAAAQQAAPAAGLALPSITPHIGPNTWVMRCHTSWGRRSCQWVWVDYCWDAIWGEVVPCGTGGY